jgi:membrane AbrB-like protein
MRLIRVSLHVMDVLRGRGQWVLVLALSAVFVVALEALRLPAALLLGPMIAGILVAAAGGTIRVAETPYAVAQALIGLMIARAIPVSVLGEAAANWPVFLLGVGSTIVVAAAIGWTLAYWRVLPGTAAIWGSSPGAASAMIVMADAYGSDMRLVAFMQYTRMMCVAGAASVVASIAGRGHPMAEMVWFPPLHGIALAETLAVAAAGVIAARLFAVRAGAIILPMVIGSVLMNTGLMRIELPPWLLAVSYALLGWTIGLRFTREILHHAARALPRLLVAIAVLIAACAGFGMILVHAAGVDPLTAYLATSPGGADAVAIIAASSNVDQPFVLSMQIVRFALVMATGPALARFLAGKAERS